MDRPEFKMENTSEDIPMPDKIPHDKQNWEEVRSLAIEYVEARFSGGRTKNFSQHMLEEAVVVVYGPNVWDILNEIEGDED